METRIMERKFVGHKMARREFFSNVIHVYIYIYREAGSGRITRPSTRYLRDS